MDHVKIVKTGAIAGIIGPIVALIFVFYAVYSSSWWFSWYNNSLSDLGISPVSAYFNYPLIFEGFLNLIFVIGLYFSLNKSKLTKFATVLLAAGGVSLALVGIFTESTGLHRYVSLGYFVLFPAAMIILSMAMFKDSKTYSILTLYTGVFAFAGIAFSPHGEGIAIPEIVEALILSAWIVGSSARMLALKSIPLTES